jgi:RNA polymerase sigma-70 factor (ECF subfamily)
MATQPQSSGPRSHDVPEFTVAAARAGDHEAIGELGAAAFRRIVTFYRYTGVSADHAEDLAADAVESIIGGLPGLNEVAKYDAWMWSIARNRLRDYWRSNRRPAAREPLTPDPLDPSELAVLDEEHRAIRTALQSLSLKDRELLWLREVVQLDYGSIGDRLEMTATAARVASHRARKRLQRAYETIEPEEEAP